MPPCQSLLIAAPSLWVPRTSASPTGRIPSSTSTCQRFFLPPRHPTQLDNSCLVAKRERRLCRTSLREIPDASQNTSSFLVSTSPGCCQVQSKLWLSWVTSKHRQWWANLKQVFFAPHKLKLQPMQYLLLKTEICNGEATANM